MFRTWFILLFFFASILLRAQESSTTFFRALDKNERFDAGVPLISGMMIPVYTPEMGLSLEVAGVINLKTKCNNPYLSHSVVPAFIKINRQGSMNVNLHPELYWFDDLVLIDINVEYLSMEDNYWGVGFDKGDVVEKNKSTTGFQRKSFLFQPQILFRIANNFYGGIASDIHSFRASNLADLMLEDPEVLAYGTQIFSGGLGIITLYDKRNIFDPVSYGLYFKVKGISYLGQLNSDYSYQKIDFDYRHFLPVIRKGSIIALQLKSSLSFGNVPWTDMPQPGGSTDLRGYYQGQYRDNHMLVILVEYRHFFTRPGTDLLSRYGFVYWLGGGTVFREISGIKHAILSTGGGYRYRMQPNITLRIDIGFGTENIGIYLGLNEAF